MAICHRPESLFNVTEIVPLSSISESQRGGVISIGNFDGVHLGHVALLSEVTRMARQVGGPAMAVVLDPHPAAILRPQQSPARLSWIERRAERMSEHGIDYLVVCRIDREFLQLSAESFFQQLVVDQLGVRAVVEGPNFFFGRDRGGNVQVLESLCAKEGVELSIVDPTLAGQQMISSTRIRRLLAESDVEQAAHLLGTYHRIRGRVVEGSRRGRQLGFPTANLSDVDVVTPALGVYGGLATVDNRRFAAAIHIGPSPTFEQDLASKIEVHLLDYKGDLYGQSLLVDFVCKVRDIARFDSADQLAAQLARDVETIQNTLAPILGREH